MIENILLPLREQRLQREVDRGIVIVPVSEVEGQGFLVVDVAELGVLNGTVFPDKVLPVDHRKALRGLFTGEYSPLSGDERPGRLITPPALAMWIPDAGFYSEVQRFEA